METGTKTFDADIDGDKLYQKRARLVLPILVRQAKAEQPIYYSDLAEEIGMPNPRNLNYVLGAIGNTLKKFGEIWNEEIPLINFLVINKSNGLPGEGIYYFIKDREYHVKTVILPFLGLGNSKDVNVILCDRYYHSTIAYQCAQGIDSQLIIDANSKFPKPDITFILDLSPDIALKRMKSRDEKEEKFEKTEFMIRLQQNFINLPKLLANDNIKIIDASHGIKEVFERIKEELDKLIIL